MDHRPCRRSAEILNGHSHPPVRPEPVEGRVRAPVLRQTQHERRSTNADNSSLRAQRGNPVRHSPKMAVQRSGLPRRLRLLAMTNHPRPFVILNLFQDPGRLRTDVDDCRAGWRAARPPKVIKFSKTHTKPRSHKAPRHAWCLCVFVREIFKGLAHEFSSGEFCGLSRRTILTSGRRHGLRSRKLLHPER